MSAAVSAGQLSQCWPISLMKAGLLADVISPAMDVFEINNPARKAAFLAQIGHESGCGKWLKEIWGPTEAQLRYEGRKDLGNLRPGDGHRFAGRGFLQITGRSNYMQARDKMRLVLSSTPDFEQSPELLEMPRWAAYSAAWFWKSHGLNELADEGDFERVTRKINGGLNGYDQRLALWEECKMAFGDGL